MLNKIKSLNIVLKFVLIVASLAIFLYLGSYIFRDKNPSVQYQTRKVSRGTIIQTVSGSGKVSSANITPVVTQVTGTVTKLYVNNGDMVKSGDAIAQIDLDQDSKQSYTSALASYQNAKNSVENAKTQKYTLKQQMLSSQEAFEEGALDKYKSKNSITYQELELAMKAARDKYNNQDAVIAQAESNLWSASLSLQQVSPKIIAPIGGKITGLAYQVGSVIPAQARSSTSTSEASSQTIANITTSSTPIVSVDLTEIDIPNIALGQNATITLDALPGKTFTGKIFSINTTGNVSSGVTTYPVTIYLDSSNDQIYANMSVTATIVVSSKENVLFVPTSAIVTQNDKTSVRVLVDNKLKFIPVTLGISNDTQQEITSDLKEGEEVITSIISASTSGNTSTTSPFGIRTGGFSGGGAVRVPNRN